MKDPDSLLRFPRSHAVLSVSENQPPHTEVGELKVLGDHNHNLEINIHPVKIRRQISAAPVYGENSTLISISTLEALDHESDPELKFRILLSNPESHERAVINVNLFVKNINDNAPVFKQKIYSLTAPLSIRRFESVGQVSAVDPDGDKVIYRVVRKGGPFVIVPQTGEILLSELPELRMYLLQVLTLPPIPSSLHTFSKNILALLSPSFSHTRIKPESTLGH